MSEPKVTVLMSVYNGEKYLREAVDSILNQTYGDFEFLIINDGSSDGTRSILESYHDPRIRIIDNVQNIGLTKSLNKGLGLARGRYVARMDADDVSLPDRLYKEVSFLDTHPDIGLVGGNVGIIDGDGKVTGEMTYPETSSQIKWCMLFFNPLVHPTLLIRKEIFDQAGGYNENMRYAQDYDLWCRMARITRLWNLQDRLINFRMHGGRVTFKKKTEQTYFSDQIKQDFVYALIGERVSREDMQALQESRQGDSPELPLLIYRLCKAMLKDKTMTGADRKFIRKDGSKKVLYRYNFVRNPNRLKVIRCSFELSPLYCLVMLSYDMLYMLIWTLRMIRGGSSYQNKPPRPDTPESSDSR